MIVELVFHKPIDGQDVVFGYLDTVIVAPVHGEDAFYPCREVHLPLAAIFSIDAAGHRLFEQHGYDNAANEAVLIDNEWAAVHDVHVFTYVWLYGQCDFEGGLFGFHIYAAFKV